MGETHAGCATEASSGAPYGTTRWGHETCEGCAEIGEAAACGAPHPLVPYVELPVGPRNV
eukprot:3321394-Pyramimonas_sp.AAC.1